MKIQISHSGGGGPWFVVQPGEGETQMSLAGTQITNQMAVDGLLKAGRAVYEVDTDDLAFGLGRNVLPKTGFTKVIRLEPKYAAR